MIRKFVPYTSDWGGSFGGIHGKGEFDGKSGGSYEYIPETEYEKLLCKVFRAADVYEWLPWLEKNKSNIKRFLDIARFSEPVWIFGQGDGTAIISSGEEWKMLANGQVLYFGEEVTETPYHLTEEFKNSPAEKARVKKAQARLRKLGLI